MLVQLFFVTIYSVPVKHTKYFCFVISAQNISNPFGESLCIVRLVTKIFWPDIEFVVGFVVDMCEIIALCVHTATYYEWV